MPTSDQTTHRLMRLSAACRSGQLAGVELELHTWYRQPDCPPEARVMLAGLLARRGKFHDAHAILEHCLNQDADQIDPAELQILISTLIRDDLIDAARRVARRLYDAHGDQPHIADWLINMCAPGADKLPDIPDAQVQHLAGELIANIGMIRSLVAAAQYDPKPRTIALLRLAIARIAWDYAQDQRLVILCCAMAQLAMLAGDQDDARRWSHRGLKLDPYCATLAIVLGKISDEPSVGPPARKVLLRVARRHPDYPDVRVAAIRRTHADGKTTSARRRLAAWLRREPTSPLALELSQEMAA